MRVTTVILVLIIGLLMNAIALPIAARRALFLYRLISQRPARARPHRGRHRPRSAPPLKRQVVEVFGQKKLLKWSRARAPRTSSCSGRS